MFVVIDGIDGAGKSTQIKKVKEKLEAEGKTVKVISYPRYNEESSFLVKKYLNGEYGNAVGAKQASLFYAIDRFDSSFSLRDDLKKYDYIITDRYVSANMIHQAGKISDKIKREDFLNWLEELEFGIFNIPKPDKVIFLNVTPKVSMQNMDFRGGEDKEYITGGKVIDIHEEDKNHLKNAHASAIQVVNKYADWVKIDCEEGGKMRSIEEINNDIMNEIL